MSLESDSSSFASSSIDSDKNSSTGYSFYTPLFMIYTSFSTTNYYLFIFLKRRFCIIEGPETVQDFAKMELQEIQDNIRSRRNKIFLHMEEVIHIDMLMLSFIRNNLFFSFIE
jgi:hypothetical protein